MKTMPQFSTAAIGRLARPMALALVCALVLPLAASAAEKTLYERLGGYDALSAVTKDLAGRLVADPKLGRFWAHRGKDGIDREVQLIVDFLAAKSGGPLYYRGRDMKLSHVGMKIDGEDWGALMKHLGATLDKFNVPAKERADVVAFMESTKADIVEVK
jgi:hemoglobin